MRLWRQKAACHVSTDELLGPASFCQLWQVTCLMLPPQVVHSDLKTSNILLNKERDCAKVPVCFKNAAMSRLGSIHQEIPLWLLRISACFRSMQQEKSGKGVSLNSA